MLYDTATLGPALDGTPSLMSVQFDLVTVDYSTSEHVVEGTAMSFVPIGEHGPDGVWPVEPAQSTPFTTRLVIYRPTNPARANGTVIVEWLNVTGGLDVPALWMPTQRHLVREGFTWVGVSAQLVGIEGGGMMPGMGLRQTAPERYDSLSHPGDAYSFDIFTQVARAVLDSVPHERAIACGASQSAMHLTTYVNAIDPLAEVFDAYLLQGRSGSGVPLAGWDLRNFDANDTESRRSRLRGRDHIRADARVPVLIVQSETDVFGALSYLSARQDDSERFRLWEVAGAAHCDTYFLCAAPFDSGALTPAELADLIDRPESSGMPVQQPMNAAPAMHFVLQRAFAALDEWIRSGTPPAHANRLATDGDSLAVDDAGIGRGGVRTPWVDAPTAVYSGLGQPGAMNELFGTTRPLPDAARVARYPGGRDDFLAQFRAATAAAVDAGFVLAADAAEIEGLGAQAWPA